MDRGAAQAAQIPIDCSLFVGSFNPNTVASTCAFRGAGAESGGGGAGLPEEGAEGGRAIGSRLGGSFGERDVTSSSLGEVEVASIAGRGLALLDALHGRAEVLLSFSLSVSGTVKSSAGADR